MPRDAQGGSLNTVGSMTTASAIALLCHEPIMRLSLLPYQNSFEMVCPCRYDLLKVFQTGRSHMVVLTRPPPNSPAPALGTPHHPSSQPSSPRQNGGVVTIDFDAQQQRQALKVHGCGCGWVGGVGGLWTSGLMMMELSRNAAMWGLCRRLHVHVMCRPVACTSDLKVYFIYIALSRLGPLSFNMIIKGLLRNGCLMRGLHEHLTGCLALPPLSSLLRPTRIAPLTAGRGTGGRTRRRPLGNIGRPCRGASGHHHNRGCHRGAARAGDCGRDRSVSGQHAYPEGGLVAVAPHKPRSCLLVDGVSSIWLPCLAVRSCFRQVAGLHMAITTGRHGIASRLWDGFKDFCSFLSIRTGVCQEQKGVLGPIISC